MTIDYRVLGIQTYGSRCEICGHGLVEVHHIGYQEHQYFEDELRARMKAELDVTELLKSAASKGFLEWDGHQLSKDDRSTNLSVLCPTCHTMIHKLDSGMKLLKIIPKRK